MLNKGQLATVNMARAELGDEFAKCTIYYCTGDAKASSDVTTAVQALHTCDFLPWPEEVSMIVSERFPYEYATSIVARHENSNEVTQLVIRDMKLEFRTRLLLQHVLLRDGDSDARDAHVGESIARTLAVNGNFAPCRKVLELLSSGNTLRQIFESEEDDAVINTAASAIILSASAPKSNIYWADAANHNLCSAAHILYSLANLVTPCGYRLRANMPGVGKKTTRRRNANQPLIAYCRFERMYTESHGESHIHVEPHRRRGHMRYLWKQSGFDRRALPCEVSQRLRLAITRNVRRVYIHPCWVGPRHYTQEGIDYEIEQ